MSKAAEERILQQVCEAVNKEEQGNFWLVGELAPWEKKFIFTAASLVRQEIGEWLMKRCQGFHRHNGQKEEFGHFGIYRSEIARLKEGKSPEDSK